jgi:hypothetical protein
MVLSSVIIAELCIWTAQNTWNDNKQQQKKVNLHLQEAGSCVRTETTSSCELACAMHDTKWVLYEHITIEPP